MRKDGNAVHCSLARLAGRVDDDVRGARRQMRRVTNPEKRNRLPKRAPRSDNDFGAYTCWVSATDGDRGKTRGCHGSVLKVLNKGLRAKLFEMM